MPEDSEGVECVRITEAHDFDDKQFAQHLKDRIAANPGCHNHGSFPCTVLSSWQYVAFKQYRPDYLNRLQKRHMRTVCSTMLEA